LGRIRGENGAMAEVREAIGVREWGSQAHLEWLDRLGKEEQRVSRLDDVGRPPPEATSPVIAFQSRYRKYRRFPLPSTSPI
jgi:hypothetical protein